jgi:hypothetical protein
LEKGEEMTQALYAHMNNKKIKIKKKKKKFYNVRETRREVVIVKSSGRARQIFLFFRLQI